MKQPVFHGNLRPGSFVVQVAILFAELPTFLPLLPSSVSSSSLELELNREELMEK